MPQTSPDPRVTVQSGFAGAWSRDRLSRLLIILVLAVAAVGIAIHHAHPPRPRFVIHIMADDLGYGELGSYGQTRIATPNLDRLAAQGLRFTAFYSASPVCNPARYSFMTGLHVGSTGLTRNIGNLLHKDGQTIARLMSGVGYRTAMVGKWALGKHGSNGDPLAQGFDYFFGYDNQGDAHNYYPTYLWENQRKVPLPGNEPSAPIRVSERRVTYAPALMTHKAIEFLRANHDERVYLQLDFNLPHLNNELEKLTGSGVEYPGVSRYRDNGWPVADQGYAEMVSLLDDYVGQLLAAVEELGIERETLIFFTSDNGPTLTRGEHSLERFDATAGLRGVKGTLFEGGIRVPMIAWWPGRIDPGRVTDRVTVSWDVLPTLAELAGAEIPAHIDGISFVPLLAGKTMPEQRKSLYYEFEDWIAVRHGPWKWIRQPTATGSSDLLFNLAQDPGENKNLALEEPRRLEALQAEAARYNQSASN